MASIKNISFFNFLSFEKVNIDFDPKVNPIVGPNDVGKSNLFRGLLFIADIMSRNSKDLWYTSRRYFRNGNNIGSFRIYCTLSLNDVERDKLGAFIHYSEAIRRKGSEAEDAEYNIKTHMFNIFSRFLVNKLMKNIEI